MTGSGFTVDSETSCDIVVCLCNEKMVTGIKHFHC